MKFILFLLSVAIASAQSTGLSPADVVYPSNSGVVNVKNMASLGCTNAAGDGSTDDTTSLQCAISLARNIVYLPTGTYLISGQLTWQSGGNYISHLRFQGQNSSNTGIKLADNTFTTSSCNPQWAGTGTQCNSVLYTASSATGAVGSGPWHGGGENGYFNGASDMFIDLGSGNTGAMGIDWNCNNTAWIRNVIIRGASGRAGLSAARPNSGPCLVGNLNVSGTFDYGIVTATSEVGLTFDGVTVAAANVTSILNASGQTVQYNNLQVTAGAGKNAIVTGGNMALINSTLIGSGSTVPGITNSAGLFARSVTSSGFTTAINGVAGASITEYNSSGTTRLFSGNATTSLNLSISPTPARFIDNNLANWQDIGVPSGGDDTTAIQAAMNAGKATVYFRGGVGSYKCAGTVTIPTGVRRIIGFMNTLDSFSQCTWQFNASSGGAVEVEQLAANFNFFFNNNQTNGVPLVISDVYNFNSYQNINGNGLVSYFEDAAIVNGTYQHGGQMWARQMDTETGNGPHNETDNADVWVLGYTTEGNGASGLAKGTWYTINSGRTEIIGAFNSSPTAGTYLGYFTVDSRLSLAAANIGSGFTTPFTETGAGVTHTFPTNCIGYCIAGLISLYSASASAATITISAPTGNATTDVNNINAAIAASGPADTILFRPGLSPGYVQGATQIALQGNRTYTCAVAGTCSITGNNNLTNFAVQGTRTNLVISNLVINGCGIQLSGPGGGSGSGTALTGLSITHNTLQNCQVVSGSFISDNYSISGLIQNNSLIDGGTCYINDGSCDGAFTAMFFFQMPNLTIDSNTFTHVDRGIGQYFYPIDGTVTPSQPGIRITNNTFTRLHTRAIEVQSCGVTGEVISGNYAHKWQNAFYGSWGFSMAQGFGNNPCTAVNTLIQNNVFDARDSVLNDLVTLHTDTTLCMEVSGINTTVDSNQCLSLTTAEAGKPNYWTGWDQGIYSGMLHGTLTNNCFGGSILANPQQANAGQANNFYTFGDGDTATDANSIPSISGTRAFADGNNCPNVLGSLPTIITSSFPSGVTSTAYSFTASVAGGVGPYTWSISAGSLPAGLTLASSTGTISGTPSGTGTTTFTILVTDHNSATNSLASSITVTALAGVVPDQFSGSLLDTMLWTFTDPAGGSNSESGGQLHLVAPAAALHDPRFGNANNSVQALQAISGNFTGIAKFDSIPSLQYQFEGIVVTQDSTNWITLTCGSDGASVDVNLDTSLGGANVNLGAVAITPGASVWLSLSQSGTSWTAKYSLDGVNYTTLVSFTQAFTAASIGPFAGNYNSSTPATPAFTALVDYFINAAVPDMTITMTHTGTWSQSDTGKAYTITATNSGGNTTTAPVAVSSSLPTGLVATAMAGTGWTCVLSTLTCSRSDVLAGSASYPVITLTVKIAANATTPLVPSSTVTGGGESNTANDSVTNSTVITAVVTSHSVVFTGLGTSVASVFPIMTVTDTSDTVLDTFTLTATSASYTYTTATLPTSNIRVQMTNGVTGRTATITNFTVDGVATAPTVATVFSLSHSPTCPTGFLQSTVLGCTGYMEFPVVSTIQKIDTTAPSTPTSLTCVTAFSGTVTCAWAPSIDDVGVTGYRLTKNGASIGVTTTVPSFVDAAVTKDVTYTYAVLAVDAANNASALSGTATAIVATTGEIHNGGLTIKNGAFDASATTASVPFSVVNSEPNAGVNGQAVFNSAKGYPEMYNGPALSWAVMPMSPARALWNGTNTSLGGAGSSPVTLCSALACPSGTYQVEYRLWTTATQAASTLVLTIGYNDGTAARVESSTSLDNSTLNFMRGTMLIESNGVSPITYYSTLVGSAAYSGRIIVTRKQ